MGNFLLVFHKKILPLAKEKCVTAFGTSAFVAAVTACRLVASRPGLG